MHRLVSRVALPAASVAVLAAAAAPAVTARPLGVLVPTHPHQKLPLHGGTVDSLNWSGYATTSKAHRITAVSGTFIVPAAGLVPPGFAATWAGIGGYNTKDLIQAGTAEQSPPSNPLVGPKYYAWYELLPKSERQLTGCSGDRKCTVRPGNRMTVKIRQLSSRRWRISERDAGHWSWSKTVKYHSSRSSAEWILEAPTLLVAQTPLAPVGKVHFGPRSTYTVGGKHKTIGRGNPTRIVLSPGGLFAEATPSRLAHRGQAFNDCAYAQRCPAP